MVEIISRKSGPRREDAEARSLIEKNRGTITKLADQLSNGAYSASRQGRQHPKEPQASGLIMSDLGARRTSAEPEPYVRISINRRVVVVDGATSRQMHHLGDLKRRDGRLRFVLATRENGYFTPVDTEIAERLAALDGADIGKARSEDALAAEIGVLLGLN